MEAADKFWSRLGVLLSFGFGGGEVARDPQDQTSSPVEGPFPAGAKAVIEWFVNEIEGESQKTALLLLIGAPGNGKSFIAKHVRELIHPSPIDADIRQLHSRIYKYARGAGKMALTVVNDATIDAEAGMLINDFDDVILQNSHLMVNVNRGVLQDELSALSDSFGCQLIRWAASDGPAAFQPSAGFQVQVERGVGSSALRGLELIEVSSNRIVTAVALYLDAYSLFEEQPEVRLGTQSQLPEHSSGFRIATLKKRKSQEFALRTPAGTFSEGVLNWLAECLPSERHLLDPFAANIQSLMSPVVRANVLTVVRCGEVAGAKRLSYREIWGLFVVLICGSYDDQGGRMTPLQWLNDHLTAESTESDQANWLMEIGNRRLNQALFGSDIDELRGGINPVHRLMRKVDPIHDTLLDMEPSMDNVHNAFYGNEFGESILEQLLRIVEPSNPVHQIVTDFDREIDRRVSNILKINVDARGRSPDRNLLLKWYGAYLTRLFALANGSSGFSREVSSWIESWNNAASSPEAQLRGDLEKGLRELIIPDLENQGYTYIPPFDARCEPFRVVPTAPRLAVRLERRLRLKSYVLGERLMVRVLSDDVDSNAQQIEFEADFDLFREVLASSSESSGFTESHARTTPRIERFRSGLASWGSNMQVISVVNANSSPVTIRLRREPTT